MNALLNIRPLRRGFHATFLLVVAFTLVGCAMATTKPKRSTTPGSKIAAATENRLRVGDQLQIRLDTGSPQSQQALDVSIDENGEVSLPLVGRIKADGLSASEFQERVQANYVPRYYVRCTAMVLVATRFFYLGGEVRAPGRYPWSDDITLMKAILTGAGFSDYANRKKVEITRGKDRRFINCDDLRAHPEKDIAIQPGDSITIPRSIF